MSELKIPCAVCLDKYGIHERQRYMESLQEEMREAERIFDIPLASRLHHRLAELRHNNAEIIRATVIDNRIWIANSYEPLSCEMRNIDPDHAYIPMDNLDYLIYRKALKKKGVSV